MAAPTTSRHNGSHAGYGELSRLGVVADRENARTQGPYAPSLPRRWAMDRWQEFSVGEGIEPLLIALRSERGIRADDHNAAMTPSRPMSVIDLWIRKFAQATRARVEAPASAGRGCPPGPAACPRCLSA